MVPKVCEKLFVNFAKRTCELVTHEPVNTNIIIGNIKTVNRVGDTFVASTKNLTSRIAPLNEFGHGWGGIARLNENKKIIGEYKCGIKAPDFLYSPKDYPVGWINAETGLPKRHLYIDYMDTRFAEHQGYGREMMKRFYLQSVESGCEGRIALDSAWGSSGFYKQLGFEVAPAEIEKTQQDLNRARRELQAWIKSKNEGFVRSDLDEIISDLQSEVESLEKALLDPAASWGETTHKLFFNPTPENVAILFGK